MNSETFKTCSTVCFCLLLAGLASSCVTAPAYEGERITLTGYPYGDREIRPRLWVTYYPAFNPVTTVPQGLVYPDKPVRLTDVRPLRDHGGAWTDDAMRYDLDGMQSLSIDGILLMLQPEELVDTGKLSRIRRFFALASTRRPQIAVGLGIYSTRKLAMGSGNFSRFLHQSGFHELPGILTLQARSPRLLTVFDISSIELHAQHFPEESHFDLRTSKLLCTPPFALIRGGDCGLSHWIDWLSQRSWPQPRGDGSFFIQSLKHALHRRSLVICLHSWNNLKDGSCLQENTFDGDLMLRSLQQVLDELARLRER